jgi:hypothetical protein
MRVGRIRRGPGEAGPVPDARGPDRGVAPHDRHPGAGAVAEDPAGVILPRFNGVNDHAYRLSMAIYPDFKRALGAARTDMDRAILRERKSLPIYCRVMARLFWWRVLRVVAPMILQVTVEFLMQRRGWIAPHECSHPVRRALSGDGLEAWER